MKTLLQISVLALFTLASCTSSLYTGAEYDDLYYTPSDQPVVKEKAYAESPLPDRNISTDEYYDNIYASDTLYADDYSDAVDMNNQISDNSFYGNGYDYYDNISYASRLSRLYGDFILTGEILHI